MIQSKESIANIINLDHFSDAISEKGYFIKDLALDSETINQLMIFANRMKSDGEFKPAKIGRSNSLQSQQKIRGDEISWIEKWDTPDLEKLRCLLTVLVEKSRYELFQSTKRFESHFAFYPPGAAYERHVDCHKGQKNRVLTAILYIGPWQLGHGGELYLHPKNANTIKISPEPGKLVVFKSEMEHEVKLTKADRWSITTWIRNDDIKVL